MKGARCSMLIVAERVKVNTCARLFDSEILATCFSKQVRLFALFMMLWKRKFQQLYFAERVLN